jgi:hypothetical protein
VNKDAASNDSGFQRPLHFDVFHAIKANRHSTEPCSFYTHNDVYYGYKGAIAICLCSGNLMQEIMNEGGSQGSTGIGFGVFDSNQAGRATPNIHPPLAAAFLTKPFNPATDYRL